jgi:hypothetical protein
MFHRHPDLPFPRHRLPHIAAHVGMAILFGGALVLGFGYTVMLLWNGIMPALLSVGHLSYWHSVGLLLLARILVGGFRHGGHGGRHRGIHGSSQHQYENWWREHGEQSFRDFSTNRPNPGS